MFKQSQQKQEQSQTPLSLKNEEQVTVDKDTQTQSEKTLSTDKFKVELPYHLVIEKSDLKTKISLVKNKEESKPSEPIDQYYQLYDKSVKMLGLMLTLQYAIQNQQEFYDLSFTNQVYNLMLPTILGLSFGKHITYMSMLYKIYNSFM